MTSYWIEKVIKNLTEFMSFQEEIMNIKKKVWQCLPGLFYVINKFLNIIVLIKINR
jgi:hypothetical protein